MKKLLSLVAAAAALTFASGANAADMSPSYKAPPYAPPPAVSGYVGLWLGWTDASYSNHSSSDPHGTAFVFGGNAAASVWITPGISVQFTSEAEGNSGFKRDIDSLKESRFSGIMGSHLSWRDPSRGAFGVFGAFTGTNGITYCGANGGGLVGIEGQAYYGMLTLYGQAGWGSQFNNGNCGALDDYWFLRGVARYFMHKNWMLYGELAYADGTGQFTSNSREHGLSIFTWAIGSEMRVDGSPFSWFAELHGNHLNGAQSGSRDVDQYTVLVGGKINFGLLSLFDNDKSGATFSMPKFHRAIPWSCIPQC